jgi:hypothetical protein
MKIPSLAVILAFCVSLASARDFRPESHMENITLANSSVQQCYLILTTPGVGYTVEFSNDLSIWIKQDEIYGLGQEYAVTMREFTPAPPPPPGTPPAVPPQPAINASIRMQPVFGEGGGTVVSWASFDHGAPVVIHINGNMDLGWMSVPLYVRSFSNCSFFVGHPGNGIAPVGGNPVLGPKDSAMLAALEESLPAMNQEVAASVIRARNAPPPAPPDPDSKRFWRVHLDATLDTDQDGSPDAKDPDADDNTATFPIGPVPRYALFPITNAHPTSEFPNPFQINDKGTVLYDNGTWKGGVWTPLTLSSPIKAPVPVPEESTIQIRCLESVTTRPARLFLTTSPGLHATGPHPQTCHQSSKLTERPCLERLILKRERLLEICLKIACVPGRS